MAGEGLEDELLLFDSIDGKEAASTDEARLELGVRSRFALSA